MNKLKFCCRIVFPLFSLALVACENADPPTQAYDDSALRAEVEDLAARVSELEGKANQPKPSPANIPNKPPAAAILQIGNEAGTEFGTFAGCQEARQAILTQYDEQCRASGAIACGNPRVVCIPR